MDRDDTIGDKEKRIHDLKKKNQELEKFKFVLDYKIKELRKQIEPREIVISDMKKQIEEMDQELENYHQSNANLDLTISDLKRKLQSMQKESAAQRKLHADAQASIQSLQHDIYETTQCYQDPNALKESVKRLYHKHVTEQIKTSKLDEGVEAEYRRQRKYLERSIESLKQKLQTDAEAHRKHNMRALEDNSKLIKEIDHLRLEIKQLKQCRTNARGCTDADQDNHLLRLEITELRKQLNDHRFCNSPS
eukprot:scaffold2162_cov398-Prasinococcus_capsulatus_cf.AAC.5